MELMFLSVLVVLLSAIVALAYVYVTRRRENNEISEKFPYVKRKWLMTKSEQVMFDHLIKQYGNEYYVFPQINMDKLVMVKDTINKYRYLNKINRKSIDFVLVNKKTMVSELVIELDDPTHRTSIKRQERDVFVNRVLSVAGYKYLRTNFEE